MKGLSKGRYDETFAGEDAKTYAKGTCMLMDLLNETVHLKTKKPHIFSY